MTAPSVTYTFTNGTVADADQVNTNFTNVINALTDGTKSFSIDALTCAGTVLMNGAVTLGNATGDDITVTGYLASNLIAKTTNTYALGSSSLLYSAVYSTLFLAGDGSAAAPAYSFNSSGSGDNGMYLSAANEVSLATAGTQRVVVDANGAFGIGVSAVEANYKSEISHTGRLLTRITSTDAGADIGPYLVLMRNSSSPAASDSIGAVAFSGKNASAAEVTYARIGAIITDTTAGSEDADLVFLNNKAGTVTESMRILSTGNIGIGTTAPDYAIQLGLDTTTAAQGVNVGGSNSGVTLWSSASGSTISYLDSQYNNSSAKIVFRTKASATPVEAMTILGDGKIGIGTASPGTHALSVVGTAGLSTGTAWTNTSDIRLKNIYGVYTRGLKEIMLISPIRFRYSENNPLGLASEKEQIGFSAQEVLEVIPESVSEDNQGYLQLNVDPIHWALVNAVKELSGKLDAAVAEIEALKAR